MVLEKLSVLHVAKVPMTGVWTLMKELALSQAKSGMVKPHFGLYVNRKWGTQYNHEAQSMPWPVHTQKFPDWSGSYLLLLLKNHLKEWILHVMEEDKPSKIIVHFHDAWMSGLYLPVWHGLPSNVSCVATVHGVPLHTGMRNPCKRALYKLLCWRMIKRSVSLTSVDKGNLGLLWTYLGLNPDCITVVPNGLVAKQSSCLLQNNSTRVDRALVAGFVGLLNPQKGWRIAVESVRLLVDSGFPCKLLIAGAGLDEQAVRIVAKEYPFVCFLGNVPNAGDNLIPDLDVLLLPSESEGQPMVILEAMAAGVPVIATRAGGITELIDNGQTGILVEREAGCFASAIKSLLDQHERERLGSGAAEKFKKTYDISNVSQKYLAVYRRAAGYIDYDS